MRHRWRKFEIGNEAGLGAVGQQFGAGLRSDGEDFCAIFAGDGNEEVQRSVGQLHGLGGSSEPGRLLGQKPEIGFAVAEALEQEVLAIRRPTAAAFARSRVPAGKQWAEVGSVFINLPNGAETSVGIMDIKTEPAAVGRNTKAVDRTR